MGDGLQRAFAAAKSKRTRSKPFPGGTFTATVIVDRGSRGEVRMLIDGRTFIVHGSLANGMRSLASGTIDDEI